MTEISILYEDDDLLVLDKPSGITVNRSDTTKGQETVQDFVESRMPIFNNQSLKDHETDFIKRSGIVHRIDKETSGILLVAKNLQAFESLQKQFKDRIIKKTYLALAHGKIIPEKGEINVPVERLPWDRKKFGVLAGGKESITQYRVISTFKFTFLNKKVEDLTLLELFPKTGRTHQIRVHLKYFNHPIFSDFLYAGRKTAREDRKILNRVFLHAHKITFIHPKTGREVNIESPLPLELKRIVGN